MHFTPFIDKKAPILNQTPTLAYNGIGTKTFFFQNPVPIIKEKIHISSNKFCHSY